MSERWLAALSLVEDAVVRVKDILLRLDANGMNACLQMGIASCLFGRMLTGTVVNAGEILTPRSICIIIRREYDSWHALRSLMQYLCEIHIMITEGDLRLTDQLRG